jgi:hypothetical protein
MILMAALTRLIPHYPNFTAVGAIALFGGAYFNDRRLAFAVPVIAMFITDLIIGLHATMLSVYISIVLTVVIGFTLKNRKNAGTITLGAISASVMFFIITNFGMWLSGTMYPLNLAGLAECYVAAIPFYQYTALGDLFYSAVLFGAFELVRIKFPKLAIN